MRDREFPSPNIRWMRANRPRARAGMKQEIRRSPVEVKPGDDDADRDYA